MDTTEGNKLIAEFMDCIIIGNIAKRTTKYWDWPMNSGVRILVDHLKYNSSWDWLMPVKEKIEMLDCIGDFSIGSSYGCIEAINQDNEWNAIIYEDDKPIDKIYWLIIEFIQWYNENNGKKDKS